VQTDNVPKVAPKKIVVADEWEWSFKLNNLGRKVIALFYRVQFCLWIYPFCRLTVRLRWFLPRTRTSILQPTASRHALDIDVCGGNQSRRHSTHWSVMLWTLSPFNGSDNLNSSVVDQWRALQETQLFALFDFIIRHYLTYLISNNHE
jgi:hypothetical protein